MAVEKVEVQVDVDTKGAAKNIDALNKKVETSIGDFDNLNEAISKTQDTLGKIDPKSAQFKELSKELAGLKDRLKDTEVQSVRFTEALAKQPGVVGLVGQSLEGLRGTLKVFMANPIIAVVAALAGAFLLLKESLTKTTEGQETLNRISAAFGKILGPVMAIVEKVALPIFEAFASLLEKVATGFSKFARFLGISQSKIEEASINSSEVLKKASDEEKKRQEDETKKLEEENKKRAEERKRAAEEALKQKLEDIKAANAIVLEAELSLLNERDRQIKEREMRFNEEIAALKKAGFDDFTALEKEYRLDIDNINKTFDDKAAADLQAKKDKEKADKEKEQADELRRRLEELSFEAYQQQVLFDSQVQYNNASYQDEVNLFDKLRELGRQRLEAEEASQDQLATYDIETQTQRTQLAEAQEEERLGIISNALGTAAQLFGEHTAAAKALSISQAIIDTYSGANKALGAYPPPFNFVAAAAVVAGGLANVKKIIGTKQPKLPGAATPAEGPAPSFSAPQSISAPQIQTNVGQTTGTQIAQTINKSQQPIKAYVVQQDISSNGALYRRTNSAATFGG